MDTTLRRLSLSILSALSISALSACSGGGDSGGSDEPVDPDVWKRGVFHDASNFAQRCDSATPQNNWLRSWSNDTYLWYDELPDLNPANYEVPTEYFELLKTKGLSPSGNSKDNFHFWMDTEEWNRQSGSGVAVGYGFQFAMLASRPPRRTVIAYSENDQWPQGIKRGLEVVSIDGEDLAYGEDVDTLNAGLFPSEAGEKHTFVFWDPEADSNLEVELISAAITAEPVQNVQVLERNNKRVGYMLFNSHIATAESALYDAVNELTLGGELDELVLDLRYNGGGYLAIASQLAYMIAGSEVTAGKNFEETLFNDKHPDRDPVTGEKLEPIPFIRTTVGLSSMEGGKSLPTLNLGRVFVLTGPNTCSASESIINGLRGVDVEVVQIGAQTCGKPYGYTPEDNCGTSYFTIQFKGVNNKGFGEYSDGFVPSSIDDGYARVKGCAVEEDFSHDLGDESEKRLATALHYIDSGDDEDCGVYGSYTSYAAEPQMGVRFGAEGTVAKPLWRQNRIMLLER